MYSCYYNPSPFWLKRVSLFLRFPLHFALLRHLAHPPLAFPSFATMEPTNQEIAAFNTIDSVADWVGLPHRPSDGGAPASPRGSWLKHIGAASSLPFGILAGIPPAEYSAMMSSWQVDGESSNAVQRSMVGLLGTACRIAAGVEQSRAQKAAELIASREHELKVVAAKNSGGASSVAAPTQAAPMAGRSIRMATVVDQALDDEIKGMIDTDVEAAYERYRLKMGDVPRPEEDVTREQLAGLQALFKGSSPPYVDFAIFGPFGRRIQKKLKMSGMVIGASGALQQQALLGPPTVDDWKASFMVFRTGAIMLGQISPAACDAYMLHIISYAARYGSEVWPLVYQADVRARLEQLGRVARQGHSLHHRAVQNGGTSDFDPGLPREWSFRALVDDVKFWRRELEEPALLIKTSAQRLGDSLSDDAITSRGTSGAKTKAGDGHANDGGGLAKKQKKTRERRDPTSRVHNVDSNGMHLTNRNNKPLCPEYQDGKCEGSGLQCPKNPNQVHQCAKCLMQGHGTSSCRNQSARDISSGGKGGKGGKGGGKRRPMPYHG